MNVIDNPVEWALAHPERFFRTGVANELELAQSIWLDAILSGVSNVLVHNSGGAWVVAASENWLVDHTLQAAELFVRVVPHQAAGANSMRSEVVLNAFCSEVIAVASGSVVFAKGIGGVKGSVDAVVQKWPELKVAIGFRL